MQAIVEQGFLARAAGREYMDNPYLQRENMPITTGDSIEVFTAKHDAWVAGWEMEDMKRPSMLDRLFAAAG